MNAVIDKKSMVIGNINPSGNGINENVYAGELAPTITTNKGEGSKICVDLTINEPNKKRLVTALQQGKIEA